MSRPAFQQYQLDLTAYLRDPQQVARPAGSDAERCEVYRDLIFNTINSFLESAFPVLSSVLGSEQWHARVRRFITDHRSRYPLFRQLPLAFLEYLSSLDLSAEQLPAFAVELAHHEWLELKLDTDKRQVRWPRSAQLAWDERLRFNPVMELHAYRHAVQLISRTQQPRHASAEPVFLLAWRDREHRVRFMQLNASAAQLLHLLQEGASAGQATHMLSGQGLHLDKDVVLQQLQQWQSEDILIGRRRK